VDTDCLRCSSCVQMRQVPSLALVRQVFIIIIYVLFVFTWFILCRSRDIHTGVIHSADTLRDLSTGLSTFTDPTCGPSVHVQACGIQVSHSSRYTSFTLKERIGFVCRGNGSLAVIHDERLDWGPPARDLLYMRIFQISQ
jgi:hypothetical protein